MFRTHNCGELTLKNLNEQITLSGWIQVKKDLGGLTFLNLRDRYGLTQLVFNMDTNAEMCEQARALGREDVLKISGKVVERESKNPKMPTGDIEIIVESMEVLSPSEVPPFTIEDETDGGDELRMKYRYLDIRRNPVKEKLMFRHRVAQLARNFLSEQGFIEVETPFLIKSTPEGARDFLVPSRLHGGQFYALPQSPQTFKQLLMVGGMDKYFQIVKCFRDEDLRADRQPEFTQIDCEMSFATQDEIMAVIEALVRRMLQDLKGVSIGDFPRLSYADAMKYYGNDKPDIRFGMKFGYLKDAETNRIPAGFPIFDNAETVVGIAVPNAAEYTRKQLDELTEWVKRPQVGASGLVYIRCNPDGSLKSSVDKFYSEEVLQSFAKQLNAQSGDLILLLCGTEKKVQPQMSALRMEMAERLGLRKADEFMPLWIVDFPLLEWDEESGRYHAAHHPFTQPRVEDEPLLDTDPKSVRANAYDLTLNGNEVVGGSLRIYNRTLQSKMFDLLGFTPEEAQAQFGFLLDAFQYGVPPHGGFAFGFDRIVAILDGSETIRDYIAFPKNNAARDVMIDAPSPVDAVQLKDLSLAVVQK